MNLKAQTIYEKEFGIEFKGYSPNEVDKFLDEVIQDYQEFEKVLEDEKNKSFELEQKNAQLKSYIIELEGRLKATSDTQPTSSSDILKRLSRLEEIVNQGK